jgi:hypothetical protein
MRTVALEVELTHQRHTKYGAIAEFYRSNPTVVRVLWVVDGLSVAKSLMQAIQKQDREGPTFHSFVTLPDFKQSGWGAHISLGADCAKSINAVLGGGVTKGLQVPVTPLYLDLHKFPAKTEQYENGKTPSQRV